MMDFRDSIPGIIALALIAGIHALFIKTVIGLADGLVLVKPMMKIAGVLWNH